MLPGLIGHCLSIAGSHAARGDGAARAAVTEACVQATRSTRETASSTTVHAMRPKLFDVAEEF